LILFFLCFHHLSYILGLFFIFVNFDFYYLLVPIIIGYIGVYFIAHKGYHLGLSHKKYKDTTKIKILSFFYVLFTGWVTSPIANSLSHRLHHKYTDTEKDPHSPKFLSFSNIALYRWNTFPIGGGIIKDFLKSDFQKKLHNNRLKLHISFLIMFFPFIPFLISPIVIHFYWATTLVNYFCHLNGILQNKKLLFFVYPWGWKHKLHHNNY